MLGDPPPLVVHLFFSDQEPATVALARDLLRRLEFGERSPRIPVRCWEGSLTAVPALPDLGGAQRNVCVILADWAMYGDRLRWAPVLDALVTGAAARGDLLLPVSICGQSERLTTSLADVNAIPVDGERQLDEQPEIQQAILTAVLGRLPTPPGEPANLPRVFLCHSREDGRLIAQAIRAWIKDRTQLRSFLDVHDISHGVAVRGAITTALEDSLLLVVWTDGFDRSRWCQFEILEAQRLRRPVLVLDALWEGIPRIFPYLANSRVVQWGGVASAVVSEVLGELLRVRHLHALHAHLRGEDEVGRSRFVMHPPSPWGSSVDMASGESLVYPDPPIPPEEAESIVAYAPGLTLQSLSEWTARRSVRAAIGEVSNGSERPLSGLRVGLSVSASADWSRLGLAPAQQDELAVVIARELILLGARLVFGGDLRKAGLGGRFADLVSAYHSRERAPQDHLSLYLGWALHAQGLDPRELVERRKIAELELVGLPDAVARMGVGPPDTATPQGRALSAIGYTRLRWRLADACDARVCLGGQLSGFQGRYAGITEEALATIARRKALYLLGGFGGATEALFGAIHGDPCAADPLGVSWIPRGQSAPDAATLQSHESLVGGLPQAEQPAYRYEPARARSTWAGETRMDLSGLGCISPDDVQTLGRSSDLHALLHVLIGGLARLARARRSVEGEGLEGSR